VKGWESDITNLRMVLLRSEEIKLELSELKPTDGKNKEREAFCLGQK